MKCSECKNYATTKCVICVGSNNFKSKNTMNELKIKIPQGMVIDTDNSNLANGIIKFKPMEKQLPKTWEEYCDTHPITNDEYYLTSSSEIEERTRESRGIFSDRNLGTRQTCEAVLALMQLIQLRDCYNDGWKPDWKNYGYKYCIINTHNTTIAAASITDSRVLAFKTAELRDQFLNNFKELIEVAKPLI